MYPVQFIDPVERVMYFAHTEDDADIVIAINSTPMIVDLITRLQI